MCTHTIIYRETVREYFIYQFITMDHIGYRGFYSPIDDDYSSGEEMMMMMKRGAEEKKKKHLEWKRIEKEKVDMDMKLYKQTIKDPYILERANYVYKEVVSKESCTRESYTQKDFSSDSSDDDSIRWTPEKTQEACKRLGLKLGFRKRKSSHNIDKVVKKHSCPYDLCDYRCNTEEDVKTHLKDTHNMGKNIEKSRQEDFSDFSSDSSDERNLIQEESSTSDSSDDGSIRWTPEKTQEVCKRLGIRLGFRKPSRLYKCSFSLCNFETKIPSCFKHHMNRHYGIKPYKCPHEWCDYECTSKGEIKTHLKRIHSRDGFIRKLREESRVIRKLKEWGLSIDTDITIDASRNGCVSDTDRKYSRVDMVILNVTSCILILEVDEFSHEKYAYNISCEVSRMSDISAFLRLNFYTQPIFWLRYNPNGKYSVGGIEKKVSRKERELVLKEKILSMMEPDFTPMGNENIHYIYYSRVSENGPPEILEDPNFPEYVKKTVSWENV